MKREIKFRAKETSGKDWCYGIIHNEGINLFPVSVDMETICQFTGLYDKNGTDIYEGDILRNESCKGVVSYRNGAFVLDLGKSCGCVCLFCLDSLLVVGNIHDNQELLKQNEL